MFGFLLNSSMWQLVAQSDFMTRLVLLLLFSASIVCVAIIIFKMMFFRREQHNFGVLMQKMRQARSVQDIVALKRQFRGTFAGSFVEDLLEQLKIALESAEDRESQLPLVGSSISNFEIAAEQLVDEYIMKAEEYLPVLGTSAAASPLAGLFGTVWGLIHAFVNISHEKSADIAIVAPGIAEALMTTLAGLVVAIPALIFFHYFAHEIRKFEKGFMALFEKVLACAKSSRSVVGVDLQGQVTSQRAI